MAPTPFGAPPPEASDPITWAKDWQEVIVASFTFLAAGFGFLWRSVTKWAGGLTLRQLDFEKRITARMDEVVGAHVRMEHRVTALEMLSELVRRNGEDLAVVRQEVGQARHEIGEGFARLERFTGRG